VPSSEAARTVKNYKMRNVALRNEPAREVCIATALNALVYMLSGQPFLNKRSRCSADALVHCYAKRSRPAKLAQDRQRVDVVFTTKSLQCTSVCNARFGNALYVRIPLSSQGADLCRARADNRYFGYHIDLQRGSAKRLAHFLLWLKLRGFARVRKQTIDDALAKLFQLTYFSQFQIRADLNPKPVKKEIAQKRE
jgi:hypothetical protein